MTRYFWAFLCLWLAITAQAQSNFADLHGVVRDPQNQPIPGAKVALTATATGATRNLITNSVGLYEAPLIAAGIYSVSVALP
ncbi:MAG: carboxypeptidase-like regulatory domain-containing protein, partial [Acidobacteriaceae bacterium]